MDKQMKLKVKDYTSFITMQDEVFFNTWSDRFVLKGKSLPELIEIIFTFLDGSKSLEDILAILPESYADIVIELIQELINRGIIENKRTTYDFFEVDELSKYKQTLMVFKEKAMDWLSSFNKFKTSELLLIGKGIAQVSFLNAMLCFGVKKLYLVDYLNDDLLRLVEDWKIKEPSLQVFWVPNNRIKTYFEITHELPDLVVYLSDNHEYLAQQNSEQLAKHLGAKILLSCTFEGYGLISPIFNNQSQSSWYDVLERINLRVQKNDIMHEEIFLHMLGNVVALKAFRSLSGLGMGWEDHVTILDPAWYKVSNHPFFPLSTSAETNLTISEKRSIYQTNQQGLNQKEFLKNLERFIDDKMGVLISLHPENLSQLPLVQMKAVAKLPNEINKELLQCVGTGETLEDASERAVREVFKEYAINMDKYKKKENYLGNSDNANIVIEWSTGLSYYEWLGNGILRCFQKLVTMGIITISFKELSLKDCPSKRCTRMLKVLKDYYKLEVKLLEMETEFHEFHLIRLVLSNQIQFDVVGKTQSEAVYYALIQMISMLQTHSNILNDQKMLKVQNTTQGMWDDDEDKTIDWKDWVSGVIKHFTKKGMVITEFPWFYDLSLYKMGLLVGRIAINIGGDKN